MDRRFAEAAERFWREVPADAARAEAAYGPPPLPGGGLSLAERPGGESGRSGVDWDAVPRSPPPDWDAVRLYLPLQNSGELWKWFSNHLDGSTLEQRPAVEAVVESCVR